MTHSHHGKMLKVVKFVGLAIVLYVLADAAYITKTVDGIDLLPAKYGHHGWMFFGSDWAVHKIQVVRRS